MKSWTARPLSGMAQAGAGYEKILKHYYSGITLSTARPGGFDSAGRGS